MSPKSYGPSVILSFYCFHKCSVLYHHGSAESNKFYCSSAPKHLVCTTTVAGSNKFNDSTVPPLNNVMVATVCRCLRVNACVLDANMSDVTHSK